MLDERLERGHRPLRGGRALAEHHAAGQRSVLHKERKVIGAALHERVENGHCAEHVPVMPFADAALQLLHQISPDRIKLVGIGRRIADKLLFGGRVKRESANKAGETLRLCCTSSLEL